MSVFSSILNAVGVNKDTASNLYKEAGGGELIKEVQSGVKEACKQGAIVGIKDYAIPVMLGTTAVISGLIGIGYLVGKYTERRKK